MLILGCGLAKGPDFVAVQTSVRCSLPLCSGIPTEILINLGLVPLPSEHPIIVEVGQVGVHDLNLGLVDESVQGQPPAET